LTGRIQALTEALPEGTARVRVRGVYHKTIAALCWELVYHRLVQGALRQHWLDNARRHMELAFQISAPEPQVEETADPDAWLLYGRVLLESGKLDEAKAAFGAAQAGGADEQKIFPWLAEIAFEQGHYGQVKHYLSMLRQGGEKGKELAMVRAWWNK
jgi:polysaccharide biosynthesis protein PelE